MVIVDNKNGIAPKPKGDFFCARNEGDRILFFDTQEEHMDYLSKLPKDPIETKHPVLLAVESMTDKEKEELIDLLKQQLNK